jgi:hypothetical protein
MRVRISLVLYFVGGNIVQMFSFIVVVEARLLERGEKKEGQRSFVT